MKSASVASNPAFTLQTLPGRFTPLNLSKALDLGDGAVKRYVNNQAGVITRLMGLISDGGRDFVTQASVRAGALQSATCSCAQSYCPHLALLLLHPALPKAVATQESRSAPFDTARGAQPEPSEVPGPVPPKFQTWINQLGSLLEHQDQAHTLAYLIAPHRHRQQAVLSVQVRRASLSAGHVNLGSIFRLPYSLRYDQQSAARDLPNYAKDDVALLKLLISSAQSAVVEGDEGYLLSEQSLSSLLLDAMLLTGRAVWEGSSAPLRAGPTLHGELSWTTDQHGLQRLRYHVPETVERLPVTPPWYKRGQELGRLDSGLPARAEETLLALPPVTPEDSQALASVMRERFGERVPAPNSITVRQQQQPYQPVLKLSYRAVDVKRRHAGWGAAPARQATQGVAELLHVYGEGSAGAESPSAGTQPARQFINGEVVLSQRDPKAERKASAQVTRSGFRKLGKLLPTHLSLAPSEDANLLGLEGDAEWFAFIESGVAALQAKGVRVEIPADFPYRLAHIEDWYGEAQENGGWFTLDLGVLVDGEKVSLLPILVSLIATRPELFTPEALAALPDDQLLYAALPDGRKLPLPAGRVRAILSVIVELNLKEAGLGPLTLPILDAARLAQLEEVLRGRWVGAERLLELGRRLRDFTGIAPVEAPHNVHAEMRLYQLQGLSWLQFLREYGMGGILADDMGLGKTLQTLAHLQAEKNAGRADLPSLVVAPTSVLNNWQREAARFTPQLRVLALHGPERRPHFEHLAHYDLLLSTYPLLPRDLSELEQQEYHLLILDEAQNIKNARSASAKAAGGLKARHRLALTGTPLENHLGELWSQFNFLSPGLLHDEKTFRELYRTPIEKHADQARRAALAARIRPFVLRREKREVARELPPKTEMLIRVSLEGDQRDLYETVRLTMQERVRQELSARGLSRSTIAILDALLKLRQAVTDPRLVKLDAASKVRSNAKLNWLSENLPQMVEEGRRVLIFSAFATLLGHLEDTLKALNIPYSKLTGQTKMRAEQIDAFQSGQTHVFLISLKAGGVGLNLTAADTVIHYDPWWNPAAENQATDRAYRIGQDKPVFVYKLIAAGSVEERILEMQQRKAALAKGVLDGGLSDAAQLTQSDLDHLFSPLEDGELGEA